MTSIDNVNDIDPRVQFTAAAAQAAFDFDFPIFQDADIKVYVDNVLKVLTTHYTVTGEGDDTGGVVTFVTPLAGGEIVTIYRETVIERVTDFQQNGPFFASAVNDEFDKGTVIMQELRSDLNRSLRIPKTAEVDSEDMLLDVASYANKYLSFDSDGRPAPAVLSSATMTQASVVALLVSNIAQAKLGLALLLGDPRNAAEIAAAITPSTYYRIAGNNPAGLVDRYGPVGTSDDGPTINLAIQAMGNHGTVHLLDLTHSIQTKIINGGRRVHLVGLGEGQSALYWTGGAGPMIEIDNASDSFVMEHLSLDNVGTASVLVQLNGIHFDLNHIRAVPAAAVSAAIIQTSLTETVYHGLIRNSFFSSPDYLVASARALYLARGHTMTVDNCMFSGFTADCLKVGGAAGAVVSNFNLLNSRMEQFSGRATGYPGGDIVIGTDIVAVDALNISGGSTEMAGDSNPLSAGQRSLVLRAVNGGVVQGHSFQGGGVLTAGIDIRTSAAVNVCVHGNEFHNFNGPGIEASGGGRLIDQQIGLNKLGGGTTRIYDDTFTPGVTFGGNAVGMTFSSRIGRFSRQGNLVHYEVILVFSAKGSSTGALRITGLPITSAAATNHEPSASIYGAVLNLIVGHLQAIVVNGDTKLQLFYLGTGSATEFSDVNIANTSELRISGSYWTV